MHKKAGSRKKDAVRAEILAAAKNLFKDYGLDKTTMEDIAAAAGKGKSSLYYYFKKKEDVFCALAEQEHAAMLVGLEAGISSAGTAAEKVRRFFTLHDESLRSKARLYPMIFKESRKHIQLFHGLQRKGNSVEARIFKGILLDGIASGEFRSIRKGECDAIAQAAIASIHAGQLNLLLEDDMPPAKDMVCKMIDIFIRGLR